MPVPVEGADDLELSTAQREAFFRYIAELPGCSTKEAAEAVGIRRRDVKRLRREDPSFDEDYRTARGYGPQQVMSAVVEEAIEGRLVPLVSAGKVVVDENGEVIYERKRSEKLLEALYKSVTPEGGVLLGPKASLEISGEVKHTVQRGVDLVEVAKVMMDAGVDLAALAAGDPDEDEVEGEAELVDDTDA